MISVRVYTACRLELLSSRIQIVLMPPKARAKARVKVPPMSSQTSASEVDSLVVVLIIPRKVIVNDRAYIRTVTLMVPTDDYTTVLAEADEMLAEPSAAVPKRPRTDSESGESSSSEEELVKRQKPAYELPYSPDMVSSPIDLGEVEESDEEYDFYREHSKLLSALNDFKPCRYFPQADIWDGFEWQEPVPLTTRKPINV